MVPLDADDAVADWAREIPESIPIFRKYGVDYCCGGKSLAYACRHCGVDPQSVIAEIRQAAADRQKDY